MAEVHHFTYGAFNPIAAFLLAFLGSFLGLLCTGRARAARSSGRRTRWLVIGAFAIGGAAIWLMHFAAMLGFEVPASPVRYDIRLTVISMALAVGFVGLGLMIVGNGRRSMVKTALAGGITGGGIIAMHYTGMAGLHVAGNLHYRPALVMVSGVIAVVAATAALWFTQSVRGWAPITGAAALMALAVCGMHYTGMAATRVELVDDRLTVSGIRPLLMIVPIMVIATAAILVLALSALQAMTEEEFTDGAGTPRRGVHAEHPWSLKQASLMAMRRTRPSPRPVPRRSARSTVSASAVRTSTVSGSAVSGSAVSASAVSASAAEASTGS